MLTPQACRLPETSSSSCPLSTLDMTTTESFTTNGLVDSLQAPPPGVSSPARRSVFASNGLLEGLSTIVDVLPGIISPTTDSRIKPEEAQDSMLLDEGFTLNGLLDGRDAGSGLSHSSTRKILRQCATLASGATSDWFVTSGLLSEPQGESSMVALRVAAETESYMWKTSQKFLNCLSSTPVNTRPQLEALHILELSYLLTGIVRRLELPRLAERPSTSSDKHWLTDHGA